MVSSVLPRKLLKGFSLGWQIGVFVGLCRIVLERDTSTFVGVQLPSCQPGFLVG